MFKDFFGFLGSSIGNLLSGVSTQACFLILLDEAKMPTSLIEK